MSILLRSLGVIDILLWLVIAFSLVAVFLPDLAFEWVEFLAHALQT